jgi:hypothetical protein
MMVNNKYWLVVEPTPLKNHGVKVSWDDEIYEIPNIYIYCIYCVYIYTVYIYIQYVYERLKIGA